MGEFGTLGNEIRKLISSPGSLFLGGSQNIEKVTDVPKAPEGEKQRRGTLSSQARWWVQPRKKSDIIATGGEG